MSTTPSTASRVARLLVASYACVLVAAACSGSGKHSTTESSSSAAAKPRFTTTSTSPSSVATTSAASADVAAQQAVAQAYANYWNTFSYVDQRYPESQWRQVLSTVAVDPFLSEIVQQKQQAVHQGLITYGRVRVHVTVAPIGGSNVASLTDCEDASHTGLETRAGVKVTVGPRQRMEVTATAVRGSDGRWRMKTVDATRRTCSS